MNATSNGQPVPEGPGSVSGAPNLPVGFADTFTSRYVDAGGIRYHVVTGGDGSRVGFIGALRSGEDSFFEHAGLPELGVAPLERGAASELLDDRFPSLAPRMREDILIEARGNPLALLELPGSSIGARSVATTTTVTAPAAGRRLQSLFVSRIAALPHETRQLLLLAALDGSGDVAVLGAAAEGSGGLAHLEPAEKEGLVSVDTASRRVLFRHPLIRTAVVGEAGSVERRRAHRILAAALVDDPERRAWHLADASVERDETIAQLLDDVAHRTLRRGDATGAVAALTRSSELTPDATARGRRLAEAAYIGSNVTGALSDASSLLAEARRVALDGAGALYAATAASYLLVNGDGDVDTAYRLLVRAIENECDSTPIDLTALEGALLALQSLCYLGASTEMWAPFYEALTYFPSELPPALYLASTLFADPCRASADALACLDEAIAQHADADPIESFYYAYIGVFVDRLPECRQVLLSIVEDGRAGGIAALAVTALALLATCATSTGQFDEADAFADEGLAMAAAHGLEYLAWFPRQTKAMVAAYRGDDEMTSELAGEMMRWATPRRARSIHTFWNLALHTAAIGRGDFETAYQRAAAITPPGELPPYVSTAVYTLFGLVEAAVRTGRHDEAAAHVRAMRDANLAAISSRLALAVAASEALIAPPERATELYERALALPDADRWSFDLARVHLVFGEHLRRTRAITEARVHLDAALVTFDALRAAPWSARTEKELRAAGIGTPSTAAGRGELTAQELEVALLAAAGLTNKQIGEQLYMAPRTVSAHLYRAFPKLGVTSRAALRDALTAQGYVRPSS